MAQFRKAANIPLLVGSAVSFGLAVKTLDEVFERSMDRWTDCYQWPIQFDAPTSAQAFHTSKGCMNLWGAEIICFGWLLASFAGGVAAFIV